MNLKCLVITLLACIVTSGFADEGSQCTVTQEGTQWDLKSPFFVYRLNSGDGLRAKSWTNLLSEKTIPLSGDEIEIDLGDDPAKPFAVPLVVVRSTINGPGDVSFTLENPKKTLSVLVQYRWNDESPTLHKFTQITNNDKATVRILNVRLGTYKTDTVVKDRLQNHPTGGFLPKTSDKEPGFPMYLDDDFFLTLAHPASWATQLNGFASLRQYPGEKVESGQTFHCMEAIYGVGAKGKAQKNFVEHVRSRMRRVVRGHDKPYVIYDNFGSWKNQVFLNTEDYMLHSLGCIEKSQESVGRIFDICSIDFWVDFAGDLKKWDSERFPNGIGKIKPVLDRLEIQPGLWIDTCMCHWSIGFNPVTNPSRSHWGSHFCWASEPIRSMYNEAFLEHIRKDKIRLLKFDNLHAHICNNPDHDHLPDLYSLEAINNSFIEFLNVLDAESPELFIMLYWGFRSPWWMLHGDTLFDSGVGNNEAATPSQYPAPYIRDSATQKLDQLQLICDDDPWLGKDSLGVWLSDWPWNSSIGKERWQEAVVMDICRGSLLLQIWSDYDFLSPPEWEQLADFAALLRTQPECFANPISILGNPNNEEPYGYCCSDGNRAFLALNNTTWEDQSITLELGKAWGLQDDQKWNLYRWYPNPARLKSESDGFSSGVSVLLKPYEVVLIEVVPVGEKPSLDRSLKEEAIPQTFAESSRKLNIRVIDSVDLDRERERTEQKNHWVVLDPDECIAENGTTLQKEEDSSIFASGTNPVLETYTIKVEKPMKGITGFRLDVMSDPRLPSEGPGRVFNGNIALNEFFVFLYQGDVEKKIPLCNPQSSFSQSTFGGFPVANAIDGLSETAWSIHPATGVSQVAVFETENSLDLSEGAALVFVLNQGFANHRDAHNIGRFQISATTDQTILPLPEKHERQFFVQTESPATAHGGILVITCEVKNDNEPALFENIGSYFTAESESKFTPVVEPRTFPGCWQGWRFDIVPNSPPRSLELNVVPSFSKEMKYEFKAHFIPTAVL